MASGSTYGTPWASARERTGSGRSAARTIASPARTTLAGGGKPPTCDSIGPVPTGRNQNTSGSPDGGFPSIKNKEGSQCDRDSSRFRDHRRPRPVGRPDGLADVARTAGEAPDHVHQIQTLHQLVDPEHIVAEEAVVAGRIDVS